MHIHRLVLQLCVKPRTQKEHTQGMFSLDSISVFNPGLIVNVG